MKLAPKAQRFLVEALRDLPDAKGRDRLRSWIENDAGNELPPDIASFALSAFEQFEYWMKQKLESGRLDDDQRADIINDLSFVHAVENDLKKVGGKRAATG